MIPIRLFDDKSSSNRQLSIPSSRGMELESPLSNKFRFLRNFSIPNSLGIDPESLFVERERLNK